MRSISVFKQEALISGKKLKDLWEQIKKITIPELIWCVITGIMSHGKLFGALSPFGPVIYAAYSKPTVIKVLMTISIFTGCIAGGDFLIALKQTAVIFLFEWLSRIFLRNEKYTGHIKKNRAYRLSFRNNRYFCIYFKWQDIRSIVNPDNGGNPY